MSQDTTISINCTIKLKTLNFDFCLNKLEIKTDQTYFIVYKTTNILKTENDEHRFYIGQHTQYNIDPYEFDDYFGSGPLLLNSIKKHGKENFIRETLVVCSSFDDMNLKEIEWIASTSANCLIYPTCGGMNQTNGGQSVYWGGDNNPSRIPELKKRMMENSIWDEERRNKLRMSKLGKPLSEAHKKKIKENHYDNSGKNHHFYGVKLSEERRLKISNSTKGEKNPNYGKKTTDEIKNKIIKSIKLFYIKNRSENKGNKYLYILSNGENYWEFFNDKDRDHIRSKMNYLKTNIFIFKDVKIVRVLKSLNLKIEDIQKIMMDNYITLEKEDKKNIKYEYFLSNGEKYETFFDQSDKLNIRGIFANRVNNIISYNGIIIVRFLKDSNYTKSDAEKLMKNFKEKENKEYEYFLSNGEDYWVFFNKKERKSICSSMSRFKTNNIVYKGITITRVLKSERKDKL